MRAMAAILIQSIGMTPGGISPQILIRFNASFLPTGTPDRLWRRARVNNRKNRPTYLLSVRLSIDVRSDREQRRIAGVIDGFLDRDKSGGRFGMTLEESARALY